MSKRRNKGYRGRVPVPAPYTPIVVVDPDDIASWFDIPDGRFETWTDDEWADFDYRLSSISDDDQDEVWEVIQAREPSTLDKEYYAMTDTEWDKFSRGLDTTDTGAWSGLDDEGEATWTTEYEAIVAETAIVKAPAPDPMTACDCSGPGSPKQKYASHTLMCPCYTGPVGTPVYGYSGFKKQCTHNRVAFTLEDGLSVCASAVSDLKAVPASDTRDIGLGVYADTAWLRTVSFACSPGMDLPWLAEVPKQRSVLLPWPDMGVPTEDVSVMIAAFEWMLAEAQSGVGVEVGCYGGHGRTGTILACLLGLQGVNPYVAIQRVWASYCVDAIESASQCTFICDVYEALHGGEWKDAPGLWKDYSSMMHEYFPPPVKPVTYTGSMMKGGGWSKGRKQGNTPGLLADR